MTGSLTETRSELSVLFLGTRWPPESFLLRLIRGLAEAGVRVTVASKERPDVRLDSGARLQWVHAPEWSGMVLSRLLRLMWMKFWARLQYPEDVEMFSSHLKSQSSWIHREHNWYRLLPFAGKRWDVIYFPWNSAAITYFPLFDFGCPAVISCRGAQVNIVPHNPNRRDIAAGLSNTFRRAAAVHCVSEAIRKEALHYGLNPEKARIIRPAIPVNSFVPALDQKKNRDGKFRVVTTGSLIWRKGYEYALMAIRRLLDSKVPVRFEIIGDGQEWQRILFTIQDLGLEKYVTLYGQLAEEAVRDRLQQADVFLLSSLSEGISNAVLEAMACGIPVVTTDCGGMREAVRDGVEGFVVPVRDAEAMARSMEKLHNNPDLAKRMGEAGRNRVLQEFDIRRQIREFMELFHSISLRQVGHNMVV